MGYTLAGAITQPAYVLTATAVGPQTTDLCGNLTLSNTGVKQHSAGTDADCNWGTTGP